MSSARSSLLRLLTTRQGIVPTRYVCLLSFPSSPAAVPRRLDRRSYAARNLSPNNISSVLSLRLGVDPPSASPVLPILRSELQSSWASWVLCRRLIHCRSRTRRRGRKVGVCRVMREGGSWTRAILRASGWPWRCCCRLSARGTRETLRRGGGGGTEQTNRRIVYRPRPSRPLVDRCFWSSPGAQSRVLDRAQLYRPPREALRMATAFSPPETLLTSPRECPSSERTHAI